MICWWCSHFGFAMSVHLAKVFAFIVGVSQLASADDALFISETFSNGANGLQYVEVYNPTREVIDFSLTRFSLNVLAVNGSTSIDSQQLLLEGELPPGQTHTVCANTSALHSSTSMSYTVETGVAESDTIASIAITFCDQYFKYGIQFDGDDVIFLMERPESQLNPNHQDSFGALAGQQVTICGSVASTSGYLFQRAYYVTHGETDWARSSGLYDTSFCYWNNQSANPGLFEVSLGFHRCLEPDPTRWTSAPTSSMPTEIPTAMPSRNPSMIPSSAPSRAPTDVPSNMPSMIPSFAPSRAPTDIPSGHPSISPSVPPSLYPTPLPTSAPTSAPTGQSLFISEVFNGGPSSLRYVEIYNPTDTAVNFDNEKWVVRVAVGVVGSSPSTFVDFRDIQLRGRPLQSGYVHTICVANVANTSSQTMEYIDTATGLQVSDSVDNVGTTYCDQYFDEDVRQPGVQPFELGTGSIINLVTRDVFGNTANPEGDHTACGVSANENGFLYVRAPLVSEGNRNWDSSGKLHSWGCYWNYNLGITDSNRKLDRVTPGFHAADLPRTRQSNSPSEAPSVAPSKESLAPTFAPTLTYAPSLLPTETPTVQNNDRVILETSSPNDDEAEPSEYLMYAGIVLLACCLIIGLVVSCGLRGKSQGYDLEAAKRKSISTAPPATSNMNNESFVPISGSPPTARSSSFGIDELPPKQRTVSFHPNTSDSLSRAGDVKAIKLQLHGNGLGLKIIGPKANDGKVGCFVEEVLPGGAADIDGRIRVGMMFVAVNGTDCTSMTRIQLTDLIGRSIGGSQTTVHLSFQYRLHEMYAQYPEFDGSHTEPHAVVGRPTAQFSFSGVANVVTEPSKNSEKLPRMLMRIPDRQRLPRDARPPLNPPLILLPKGVNRALIRNPILDSKFSGWSMSALDDEIEAAVLQHENELQNPNSSTKPAWTMSELDRKIESEIERHEIGLRQPSSGSKGVSAARQEKSHDSHATVQYGNTHSKWVHRGDRDSGQIRQFFSSVLESSPGNFSEQDNGKFCVHVYSTGSVHPEYALGVVYKCKLTMHPVKIAGMESVIGKKHYGSFESIDELIQSLSSSEGVSRLKERWPIVLTMGWTTSNKFAAGSTSVSRWVHRGHGKGTALRVWATGILEPDPGTLTVADNGKFVVHEHRISSGPHEELALAVVFKQRVTLHQVKIAGKDSVIGKKHYGAFHSVDELIQTLSSKEGVSGLTERWPIVLTEGYSTANRFEAPR